MNRHQRRHYDRSRDVKISDRLILTIDKSERTLDGCTFFRLDLP